MSINNQSTLGNIELTEITNIYRDEFRNPNLKNISKKHLLKLFFSVYKIRRNILIENGNEEELKLFRQNTTVLREMERLKKQMKKLDDFKFLFCFDLFIRVSESWEAFALNNQSEKRFIMDLLNQSSFYVVIICHFHKFRNAFSADITIELYNDKSVMDKVKLNLIQNKSVLEEICMQKISQDDIEQYLDEIQIFGWRSVKYYAVEFYGFASYDGKRIHISLDLHIDLNIESIAQIIEHEVANHFYFWLIKNTNPMLIMSEINGNLYDQYKRHLCPGDQYIQDIILQVFQRLSQDYLLRWIEPRQVYGFQSWHSSL